MRENQLIVIADMEGASGIVDDTLENRSAIWPEEIYPQGRKWREYGRECITSDVLAVCRAALDHGVRDILLYDSHYAGCRESNVIQERLPQEVRMFDVPQRRFYWRRIRGQAAWEPLGLITVGSHAMNRVENAYFPHTLQTPPIDCLLLNGQPIGEVSAAALNFDRTPYIANIGCAASHAEARALSPQVSCVTVKDKARAYVPTCRETYPIIYDAVRAALQDVGSKTPCACTEPCVFELRLCTGFVFDPKEPISWKGIMEPRRAVFEAPTVEIGFELLNLVRDRIIREV